MANDVDLLAHLIELEKLRVLGLIGVITEFKLAVNEYKDTLSKVEVLITLTL